MKKELCKSARASLWSKTFKKYGDKCLAFFDHNLLTAQITFSTLNFDKYWHFWTTYQTTHLFLSKYSVYEHPYFYKQQLFSTLRLLGIQLYSRIRNLCQSHFWRHYECERKIMSSFLFMLFFAFSWVPLLFRYTALFSAKKVSLYAKLTDLHLRDFILIKIKVPDSFKATLWKKV